MEVNQTLIDKIFFKDWSQHIQDLGGMSSVRLFQFKFKLLPFNNYANEFELLEEIKQGEVMDGRSIFCKQLLGIDALALINRFSNLIKIDFERENILDGELYFLVAYVYTLEKDFHRLELQSKIVNND